MTDLFWFSGAPWPRNAPMLPKNTGGLKCVDDRRVFGGIVNVVTSGG